MWGAKVSKSEEEIGSGVREEGRQREETRMCLHMCPYMCPCMCPYMEEEGVNHPLTLAKGEEQGQGYHKDLLFTKYFFFKKRSSHPRLRGERNEDRGRATVLEVLI